MCHMAPHSRMPFRLKQIIGISLGGINISYSICSVGYQDEREELSPISTIMQSAQSELF